MIVMAIIGILAAVLFPSITRYLVQGRDTSRKTAVAQISTAVSSYAISNQWLFPTGTGSGDKCINKAELKNELQNFPTDPIAGRKNGGCLWGEYGYGVGENSATTKMFAVSAELETQSGGQVTVGDLTKYQGSGATVLTNTMLDEAGELKEWVGRGYVMVR